MLFILAQQMKSTLVRQNDTASNILPGGVEMQEFRVKRTGRDDLVFQGEVIFAVRLEKVKFVLYLTRERTYVLSREYYFLNLRYLKMAYCFDMLKELNAFATSEKDMDAVRFIIKNDASFSRAIS